MSTRFFRVFSGLLTPDHRKRMGSSVWTFLWMIDHITDETIDEETGQRVGYVLYGNPKSYEEIGIELGYGKTAIYEHCEKLRKKGYISIETTTRGNIFTVLNSKKWHNPPENRSENQSMRSGNRTNRSEKRTVEEENRSEKRSDRSEKRSNRSFLPISILNKRDIKEKENNTTTITQEDSIQEKIDAVNQDDHLTDFERLENRYIELRTRGTQLSHFDVQSISETLKEVPYDAAVFFLKQCFEKRTNINSFRYCQKYIVSEYQKAVERHKAIQKEQRNKVVPFQLQAAGLYEETTHEYKLAELLLRLIVKDQRDFTRPDVQQWAMDFHALLAEGKEAVHIQDAIVYARKNNFWKTKILSPADLKRNYDRLRAQSQAEQAPNAGKRNQHVADMPKWATSEELPAPSVEQADQNEQAELQALLAERSRRRKERKHGS